jgi:hypothetical protein
MADEGSHDDSADDTKPHDVVLVHGRTPDGAGLRGLRSRPGSLALAELRPILEGKPLQPGGELVRLKAREGSPLLWNVETVAELPRDAARPEPAPSTSHEGPPRVSTESYRENWERIFGARRRPRGDDKLN